MDDSKEISANELKSLLEADRRAREQRAIEKINAILAEERCVIKPIIVLTHGSVAASAEITALD